MKKTKTTNGHTPSLDVALSPVFAGVRFDEGEFAHRRAQLDLYDDMIIQTRFDVAGQMVDSYPVDPLDIAMRLGNVGFSTGLMPPDCLFFQRRNGEERVGIAIEPKVWTVRISGEKEPLCVPLPAMVFVGSGREYSVFALSGHNWPKLDTALFVAPCSNVSNTVCRGNAPFPVAGLATIREAWTVFIESEFNTHLDTG